MKSTEYKDKSLFAETYKEVKKLYKRAVNKGVYIFSPNKIPDSYCYYMLVLKDGENFLVDDSIVLTGGEVDDFPKMRDVDKIECWIPKAETIWTRDGVTVNDYWEDGNTLKGIDDYDSINAVFNERLQQQIDGVLPQGFIYELGMPGEALLSAGIDNLPVEMAASRLVDKSMQENHPFDLSEIFDFPNSIQNPIAVFRSATVVGTYVVLTNLNHDDKNFVAALHLKQNKRNVVVNSVRSVHPRTKMNIVNWINDGLAEYFSLDFNNWLTALKNELRSKPQYNSADVRAQLNNAAKIVKNFYEQTERAKKNENGLSATDSTDQQRLRLIVETEQFLRNIAGNRYASYPEMLKSLKKYGHIDQLTPNQVTQSTEAAIALAARNTVRRDKDMRYNFDLLLELYRRQPSIQAKEGRNFYLQQYSTPAPLAYLAGEFVRNGKTDGLWLEPSAGNALLMTAFKGCGTFFINELDPDRCHNLQLLYGHEYELTNRDASDPDMFTELPMMDGVITNPPFGPLKNSYRHKSPVTGKEYLIESLDHKMALLALSRMKPDGRAAVIVGGKLFNAYWKPLAGSDKKIIFGKWKEFLRAVYDQYNIIDCIYIDGSEIYKKQGTTYPIALLLIDGCNEVAQKPNFVFDPERDIIIKDYSQLYDRIAKHIGKPTDNTLKLRLQILKLKAKAKARQMNMKNL